MGLISTSKSRKMDAGDTVAEDDRRSACRRYSRGRRPVLCSFRMADRCRRDGRGSRPTLSTSRKLHRKCRGDSRGRRPTLSTARDGDHSVLKLWREIDSFGRPL